MIKIKPRFYKAFTYVQALNKWTKENPVYWKPFVETTKHPSNSFSDIGVKSHREIVSSNYILKIYNSQIICREFCIGLNSVYNSCIICFHVQWLNSLYSIWTTLALDKWNDSVVKRKNYLVLWKFDNSKFYEFVFLSTFVNAEEANLKQ